MAKIFYSMAGEGRGHATRARALVEMLRGEHDFTLFAPEMAYAMLSKVYEGTSVRVRRLAGLRFHYRGGTLSYAKTVQKSLGYLWRKPWVIRSLCRRIEIERPDLCITDFEPLLPRAAQQCKVPFLSFDHQHFLSVNDFNGLPSTLRWKAELLGQFTKWFYRGQKATLVSSFFTPPLKRGVRNVDSIGVMLRPEVLRTTPSEGDHLLVYLRRFPHGGLIDALKRVGREAFIYGVGPRESEGNIHFKEIDETNFLSHLASCHALICNAGNQLVGEAFHFRKPVLAIPEAGNFEQYINAHYVRQSGGGDWIEPQHVSSAALQSFFSQVPTFRSQIDPQAVRGNESALAIIQKHLPAPKPVGVERHSRKKRTALPHRLVGLTRAVVRNWFRRDDLPRFLTYTVTFSCNAKCIMCDSWKLPSPDDLSVDEVSRIFDELPAMDGVRLTGGEPFVRADFPELARLADEKLKPMVLHITSNGFLTRRIVRYCEDRRKKTPLHLLVSIDGVEAKHNQVRGHSGAWKSAMETIRSLAPRQKELNIHLAVNQTIVDAEGVEHYKMLREVLRPLGVRNNVVMAYDVSATYNLEREIEIAPSEIGQFATFGEFSEDHLRELLGEIEKDLASFPWLDRLAKRYYLRGITQRLLHGTGKPNPPCVALNSHLRLFPNGDVPTCQFNSKIAGNLRRQSFRELWRSELAARQRDWVRRCPGCWAECEVLPSAIYTLDLLKESLLPTKMIPSAASRPVLLPSSSSER
ncbi:radical SAM protein [bacterium]|jgi:Fe-coproporphyrin III synthase|nr:radical SAM protein [bacterium]